MSVQLVVDQLEAAGFLTSVRSFSEIADPCRHAGWLVLYTSSEDPGLHYKSFVEDVILGLEVAGAHVSVPYALLRAHHNKSFMELMRRIIMPESEFGPHGRPFGSLQELLAIGAPLPSVVKAAAGAGAGGVSDD